MIKKKTLLTTLILLSAIQSNVYADQKILAQHENKNKPYTDYMEFGKDDHIAFITSNAGGIKWNTWNFEQGASIDNTGSTSDWDAINFDAGESQGITEYTGVINIGTENDRKKNFTVYAPEHRSVIEMNGGYGPEDDAQAILTINGGDGANLKFYGGNNKDISHSVISMYKESFLTINADTLYMEGKKTDNDNGAGGITVHNDSHLNIILAGDFTNKTSNGLTVLEDNDNYGLGQYSTKHSELNIDANNITIEAFSNVENNLNKNYNEENMSDKDVQGIGIFANTMEKNSSVNVSLNANKNINIEANAAGIYANGNSTVNLNTNNQKSDSDKNNITIITKELDTNSNTIGVYAGGTDIGSSNVFLTSDQVNIFSNNKSVWASGDGGNIEINGSVNINAKHTGINGVNLLKEDEGQHIAIVAGVAKADSLEKNHGEVKITLKGTDDSYITGDIIAARDGLINITQDENYAGKLYIKGDILAGNGRTNTNNLQLGVANVNLGEYGYWEGRADDYQDADIKEGNSYFNPHFTDGKVDTSGEVNITMGQGSVWNVTGQSWITSLNGDKSTIVLCGKDTNGNIQGTGGYSIHIGKINGNNTFVVNLNPNDVSGSDMIYIQDGTNAKQTLLVNNEKDLLNLHEGERIRFATIADAEGSFEYGGAYNREGSFGNTYTIKGRGLKNVELGVRYVNMNEESEAEKTYHDVGTNNQYNGGENFTDYKPGSNYVEETYDKIDDGNNSQNVYLVREKGGSSNPSNDDNLTDSGKTIINMSHANYKNAIYMDRLNKRLGEARYIDGDEGMWVRLRHDRIGLQNEFRSMNTMYQLGYDKLHKVYENGERHVGAAIDYMSGSTSYSDIYGKGETKRWGFWLYDTWLGNKGHYVDYIAKFGHLHNEFDLIDRDSKEKVTGDYDNNVFSISTEYGRKKDIGNNWYFEPQVQLQLARVTDAEYQTSQNTDIYVDGINSLIGRTGFRLGKDIDERNTIYLKADILHEFLGDQRIVANDMTGSLDKTYENNGTWYDLGFGFATAINDNSYAYLDFEKSFGNDNDDTYQINAGLQWSF